jgi:hypothetical protein
MTTRRRWLSVCRIVFVMTVAFAPAQAAGQQRDQPKPANVLLKVGTGAVSGRVTLAADRETPVRRAVVSLTSTDGRDHRSAVTDDEGMFAFRDVQ